MKNKQIQSIILFILCFSSLPMISQEDRYVRPSDMADAIRQMSSQEIKTIERRFQPSSSENSFSALSNEEIPALNTFAESTIKNFETYIKAAKSTTDLYNALQALSNAECVPDFTTNAAAMIPTGCLEEEGCAQCYEQAIRNMNVIRRSLARMSCIYSNTKKFNESAIAFGDNVSGMHGVMGLAWQHERKGIQEQFDQFKKTYDDKYTDLVNALQQNLYSINDCENQYGMKDWYQRFGFIYFEMMKEKYKRID